MSSVTGIGGYISIRTSPLRSGRQASLFNRQASRKTTSLSLVRQQFSAFARLQEAVANARFGFRANRLSGSGGGSTTQTTETPLQSTALTLSPTESRARVQSTGEINDGVTTSYTPTNPSFTGSSTANPVIGGTYTGTTDDVLTFTVTDGGLPNFGTIEFDVTDQDGNFVEAVSVASGSEPTLSNGLTLSFDGGGLVWTGDSFEVTVDVEESVVDPDIEVDEDDANLPAGANINNGQFKVNGQTIVVRKRDDSINAILGKINASSAGVTATFDAATETVILEQNTPGSNYGITLTNDNSGFLDAMKLSGATVVPGTNDDLRAALDVVDDFTGVQAGSFSVNGQAITVDPLNDSLEDLIGLINASSAGVTAAYDDVSGRVELAAEEGTETVSLSDNGTGFLSALGFSDGEHTLLDTVTIQQGGGGGISTKATKVAAGNIEQLVRVLEGTIKTTRSGTAGRLFRNVLVSTATEVTGDSVKGERLLKKLGFDLESSATTVEFDRARFKRGLRGNLRAFERLMTGHGNQKGFLESLDETLRDDLNRLRYEAAASGEYLY